MKFGLNFFPSFRLSDGSTAEYFAQCLRLAERADQLGFNSVKTVEHYFFEYGGHSPNPVVFLSAIAARTRRIRPITGAVIPAFNNPVKLAAELAVLDNISGGRLDAGFGRAFIPKEFEVFGVSMEESRARFEEGIDIVTKLWTEERVSYEGKFHTFQDVRLMPRPVQTPHPPIWVAAVASMESFVWAGQHGYNLMIVPYAGDMRKVQGMVRAYRDAWRDAGHPPGTEQVQTSLHCYVAETDAEAVQGVKPRVDRYIDVFGEAVSSWATHRAGQYAGYRKMVESIAKTTTESMLENNQALIGTPDAVVEQLKFQIDLFGEIEPSMQINFGGMPDDEAFRTLELFAAHVMPKFQAR
jgi:natural product biosynthesis luciferase-like monooxygenase protein